MEDTSKGHLGEARINHGTPECEDATGWCLKSCAENGSMGTVYRPVVKEMRPTKDVDVLSTFRERSTFQSCCILRMCR